jgi:hypothetical protein
MFETGDVVLLPPKFGSGKKGVLVRREPNGVWLVQIGSTGYDFLPEEVLRPLTQMTKCGSCGLQFNSRSSLNDGCTENAAKCPGCGAYGEKQEKEPN